MRRISQEAGGMGAMPTAGGDPTGGMAAGMGGEAGGQQAQQSSFNVIHSPLDSLGKILADLDFKTFLQNHFGDDPVQLAKKRAVLSQHYQYAFPLTAKEIAMMGRYPFYNTTPTLLDESIVCNAMEIMEVTNFANRSYESLSGGEAQKVQMSRVLAQMFTQNKEQKYLLLDEPVSHLDIKFQHQLLSIAKSIVTPQTAVIAVLHDLNLALKYADRIIFMKEGSIIYEHKTLEDLPLAIIKDVFGIDASLIEIPNEQRKLVVF